MVYDTVPRVRTKALWTISQRDLVIGEAITWDELIHTYGPTHRLALVLAIFISYFLVLDKGQYRLQCGWGVMLQWMLDALERFRWGECILAHMYHEMHKIVYHK